MRVLGCPVSARLRVAGAGAACVLRARTPLRVLPVPCASFSARRYVHSVLSRVATLSDPLRIPERPNVRLVKDHSEFHNAVYSTPDNERVKVDDLVVSVFVSKQNTASLSILDCVDRLSHEYPANKFLVIDADQVPRAAYDADLQQFPAALISFGGDVYRRLVQESSGYPADWQGSPQWELPSCADTQGTVQCTLPGAFYSSVKREIELFGVNYNGCEVSSLPLRSGTHSYTHGIDTDNLNVKRVGWPTE